MSLAKKAYSNEMSSGVVDDILRDQFIKGIADESVHSALMCVDLLTFSDARKKALARR